MRVCTLYTHDVTHLPLCASREVRLGATISCPSLPSPLRRREALATPPTSSGHLHEPPSYFNKSSSRGVFGSYFIGGCTCPPTSSFIDEFYEFATYFNDDERRHGQSVRRHSEFATYLIGPSSRAALLPQQALSMRHLLLSTLFSSTTRRASSHYSNDGEHPFTPCSRLNSPLQKALISRHSQDFDGLHFAKER